MNANNLLRLRKEARVVLPFWAASATWIIAPFLLRANDAMAISLAGLLFGYATIGPVCVGHEFARGTMGVLLAQPVLRRRLWWEKLAVTSAALLSLSLLFVDRAIQAGTSWRLFFHELAGADLWHVALFIAVIILVPLLGIGTGPALTLFARNSLGGAALTFLCPWALLLIGLALMPTDIVCENSRAEESFMTCYSVITGSLYAGSLFLLGCWKFQRFEDTGNVTVEVTLPARVNQAFAAAVGKLTLGSRHWLAQSVRKELRLHQPTFLFAAVMVAIFLTLILVIWWRREAPGAPIAIFALAPVLLSFIIPVLLGVVSTAEERQLGVHEWHLTLPIAAARQWWLKVGVATALNVLLGLLLPAAMLQGGELAVEFNGEHFRFDEWHVMVPINLGFFLAALYASTNAPNGLRAALETVGVVCISGGLFLGATHVADKLPLITDMVRAFVDQEGNRYVYCLPYRAGWWPAPEMLDCFLEWITPLVWLGVLWCYFNLGLRLFRRTIGLGWRLYVPLARCLIACGVIIAASVLYQKEAGIYYNEFYGAEWEPYWSALKQEVLRRSSEMPLRRD